MLKGNNMVLSIGGERLAASKGCAVDRNTETVSVCSPVDGAAKRFMPTTTGWSVQADGLYANVHGAERLRKIWRKYQDGEYEPLYVQYTTIDGLVEEGEAILTNLHEAGNVGELVKFSVSLQGSGMLLKNGVQVVFAEVVNDVHIDVSGEHILFTSDDDDAVDYAAIDSATDWRVVFTDVDDWIILPGENADWQQDLEDLDSHGVIDHAVKARGHGGSSKVLPPGKYVVYACNYGYRINCKMYAE